MDPYTVGFALQINRTRFTKAWHPHGMLNGFVAKMLLTQDWSGVVETDSRKRVVYLIGAGASQGCVSRANSKYGILMTHLGQPLIKRLRTLIVEEFSGNAALTDLANAVLTEETDFEHVITFLDNSPSRVHRQFADKMRTAFQDVLNERLNSIHEELGKDPIDLYAALLDMYQIEGFPETLQGILTLNYDQYIETAVQQVIGESVDFGFKVEG